MKLLNYVIDAAVTVQEDIHESIEWQGVVTGRGYDGCIGCFLYGNTSILENKVLLINTAT